jgi:hypothetical protein
MRCSCNFLKLPIIERRLPPIDWASTNTQFVNETTMDKLIVTLMAIYFLGDSGLHDLALRAT